MSRKMTSAMVFILALLLTTVPAWSSTPGPINPAGSDNSLTTDLTTTADGIFKTEIILARGGGGGGGGKAAVAVMEVATEAEMAAATEVREATVTAMATTAAKVATVTGIVTVRDGPSTAPMVTRPRLRPPVPAPDRVRIVKSEQESIKTGLMQSKTNRI